LEQSFQREELIKQAQESAYGRQGAALLDLLGNLMRAGVLRTRLIMADDWLSDPTAFSDVFGEMIRFLKEFPRPHGVPAEEIPTPGDRADYLTLIYANVNDVGYGSSTWASTIAASLGPQVAERFIKKRAATLAARRVEQGDPPRMAAGASPNRRADP